MNTDKIKFHSHKNHNPSCDILEYHIDKDTFITYGIYVKPAVRVIEGIDYQLKVGHEFMEIYTGENYNVDSTKRSHSRLYYANTIPEKYKALWQSLRSHYIQTILTPQTV